MPVVLLMDDDRERLDVFRRTVESLGCRPVGARNGHDAFRCLREEGPALILLSLTFGDREGLEVLAQMPRNRPPIILHVPRRALSADVLAWFRGCPICESSRLLERLRAMAEEPGEPEALLRRLVPEGDRPADGHAGGMLAALPCP